MNVLHVIPGVAPCYGGPSQAIYRMGRALETQGVSITVVTTNADGKTTLPVPLGELVDYQGIPTWFFQRQFSEALKYSAPLSRWLSQHVQMFDLVHIHAVYSHACLAAAHACQQNRVPYIVRPLGTLDPWSLQQKRWRKRLFWWLGVRQMLERAAAIHYTTVAEQKLVEQALGLARGVVIPLGTDESLFTPVTKPTSFWQSHPVLQSHPYVVVLCRLHPKKQLALFVSAFLAVTAAPALRHWRLLIVGDGESEYVASLKRLCAQTPERVIFAGWLQGDEKAQILQRAQLYALPSRQENFGIAVVEAMTCSLPVLISEHVNLADEVRAVDAGWVVPLEQTALQDALRVALSDEALRRAKGIVGQQLVRERFTWTACARQLITLYQALLKKEQK